MLCQVKFVQQGCLTCASAPASTEGNPTCRAATDRQIELNRKKRMEIERAKKAELDAERGDLDQWQQKYEGEAGDESDGEEDGAQLYKVRLHIACHTSRIDDMVPGTF